MTEQEIKTLVRNKLSTSIHGEGAAFVLELFIDSFARRADLVMANGKLSAYEIKSDRDSLHRLEGQIETYLRLFEEFTIVCAEKHLDGVLKLAPEGVGIWALKRGGELHVIKRARSIPQKSRESWLSFLSVDELRLLMRSCDLTSTGDRQKLLNQANSIPLKKIRSHVLSYFKYRRPEKIEKKKRTQKEMSPQLISNSMDYCSSFGEFYAVAIPRVIPVEC